MERLLTGRGALNVLFGLYFLLSASAGASVLQPAGWYFLADGLLAAWLVRALLREGAPAWRTGIEMAGALARVLLGAWFLLVPALSQRALTAVLALMALCAAAVGLGTGKAVLTLAFGRRGREARRTLVAAALAVAAGVAMFYAFPEASRMRVVLGVYALAHGLLLLAAGLQGARGMPRPAS